MIRRMRSLASSLRPRLHFCRPAYSSVSTRADRGEGGRPVVVQAETGNSTAQHYGRHLGLADSASEGERCDEVKWTTADREPECCIRRIHIGIASLAPTAPPGTRRSKEHHQHRAIFLRSAPHRASSAAWPTTTQRSLPAAAIPPPPQVIHAVQDCRGPQLRLYLLFTDIVDIINCSTTKACYNEPGAPPVQRPVTATRKY